MVHQLTVNDLVEKAIKEAPTSQEVEVPKTASIFALADELDKLADETRLDEDLSLNNYKDSQAEKVAAMETIVSTYLELESA